MCENPQTGLPLPIVSVKGPLHENNFKLIKNNSSGIKEMCQNNSKQLKYNIYIYNSRPSKAIMVIKNKVLSHYDKRPTLNISGEMKVGNWH